MKINFFGMILLLLTIILSGCGSAEPAYQKEMGIGVFTLEENILFNWYPNGIEIEDSIVSKKITEGSLLFQSGKRESFSELPNLESKNNMVYVENGYVCGPLAGIYLGEKVESITKLYDDVIKSLDDGVPVLVFFIDGLSFDQYSNVAETGELHFLGEYYEDKIISVFTPVTNAGFAAMITGKTPDENGVHDRSYRDLKAESIFGYADSIGKRSLLLEGEIKILNTEIEPVLHVDVDKDGDTDDEMVITALGAVNEDYDLIFIHFHGVDDRGHQYGPQSSETLDYVKTVDEWITNISSSWEGNIYATADHGMHSTNEGGDHGVCRYEDMIVPYFTREK